MIRLNVLIFLSAVGAIAQSPMDVFIMSGQSNMEGAAPGQTPVQHPNMIWSWNGNSWVQARDPLYPGFGVGPGVSFADTLAGLTGHNIGIIPCAVGATKVQQWQQNYGVMSLYGQMLSKTQAARAQGCTVRGFVWYQGESNAGNYNPDATYLFSLWTTALFSAIRQDLGNSTLPIVFVQLGPIPANQSYIGDGGNHWWADIQTWQEWINDTHITNIRMVTAKDLHSIPGNDRHLDFPSEVILGQRIATAMYSILSEVP